MNPKKILLLGGYGNTGRPLARLILQETQANLVLAGRNSEKAQASARELNQEWAGDRVEGKQVDASEPSSLKPALVGIDMVVVASSTARYAQEIAKCALEAGSDYFDIQFSQAKIVALKSLTAEIEKSGRCFITDGGFHPGLPAALVRYAATFFDSLEKANVGSVIQIDWAGLDLPEETTVELLEEINDFESVVFRQGAWKKAGWVDKDSFLRMDFGDRFGKQTCAPMMLEEMRSLPEQFPTLRETGFFVGSFNWFVDWFVFPVAMVAMKISPKRAVRPMGKWMRWGLNKFSKPPFGTLLRLEAEGQRDGLSHTLEVTLYHPDGYLFTAIPVAATLLQYLDGSITKPGLWTQGNLVEPVRLMQDMQGMGVEIVSIEK
jgi:hypothetical protein